MTEQLTPCPCGTKAELHESISMSGKGQFWVQAASGWVGPVKSEPDDAVNAWNSRPTPPAVDREAIADAVNKIICDLSDRKGLKSEWHMIDEGIQNEIKAAWTDAILQAIAPEPVSYADQHQRFLWGLLDDIDTLDDACKGHDAEFRKRAYKIQRRRYEISSSDGYTVTFNDTSPAPVQGTFYQCAGCERVTKDPEKDLQLLHRAGSVSCCPERNMVLVSAPAPVWRDMGLEELESRVLGCLDDFADMTPEPGDPNNPDDEGETWENCMACSFDLAAEKIGRLFSNYRKSNAPSQQPVTEAPVTQSGEQPGQGVWEADMQEWPRFDGVPVDPTSCYKLHGRWARDEFEHGERNPVYADEICDPQKFSS